MQEEYTSKNFDHLGIVSTICDEIGIQDKVDSLIPNNPLAKMGCIAKQLWRESRKIEGKKKYSKCKMFFEKKHT